MGDAKPDRRPEVEPPTAPARALTPREPGAHRAGKASGKLGGLGALPFALKGGDVLLRHRLVRGGPAALAAALRGAVLAPASTANLGRLQRGIVRARPMLKAPRRTGGDGIGVDPDDGHHSARGPSGATRTRRAIRRGNLRAARPAGRPSAAPRPAFPPGR